MEMGESPGGSDKKPSDNNKQVPTGITQNIKDLLSSREVENIFEVRPDRALCEVA